MNAIDTFIKFMLTIAMLKPVISARIKNDGYTFGSGHEMPDYSKLLDMIINNGHRAVKLTSSVSIEFERDENAENVINPLDILPPPPPLDTGDIPSSELIPIINYDTPHEKPEKQRAPKLTKSPRMGALSSAISPVCPTVTKKKTLNGLVRLASNNQQFQIARAMNYSMEDCTSSYPPVSVGSSVSCKMEDMLHYVLIYTTLSDKASNGFNHCYKVPDYPTFNSCYVWIKLPTRCVAAMN